MAILTSLFPSTDCHPADVQMMAEEAANPDIADQMNLDATMILLDKFKVNTGYFDLVESCASDIVPFLLEGTEYSAEDLVGAELWAGLTGFGQRQAHLCLKHMATLPGARLIDLASVDCRKTGFQILQ